MRAFVDVLDRHGAVLRAYPATAGMPEDDAIAEARSRVASEHLVPEAALRTLRYTYRVDPETDEPA
jgi:hypothetical protein